MSAAKPVKWEHSQKWFTRIYSDRKQIAAVEVRRWSFKQPDDPEFDGEYVWNIYAMVWPEHPLFADLSAADNVFECQAARDMEFHYGANFMKKTHGPDGAIICVEVGNDYNHYGDDWYRSCVTREDAASIFADAERLVAHLQSAMQEVQQ